MTFSVSSALDPISILMKRFTSVFNGEPDLFNKVKMAVDLVNDLQSIVNCDKKWLLNFTASKTKLLQTS